MLFGQALDALREGKKVKRSGSAAVFRLGSPWSSEKSYAPVIVADMSSKSVEFSEGDFFAQDWEVA